MSPALHHVGEPRGGAVSTVRQTKQPARILVRGIGPRALEEVWARAQAEQREPEVGRELQGFIPA